MRPASGMTFPLRHTVFGDGLPVSAAPRHFGRYPAADAILTSDMNAVGASLPLIGRWAELPHFKIILDY
jgi:hypothetical protein